MRPLIPGFAAFLLAAPALAAPLEQPREISIGVDVFAGGFHVLTIDSRTSLKPDGYNLETQLDSRGFVGWVSGFSQHTLSEGRIADGELQPTTHLNRGIWRGDTRRIEMRYGAQGPVDVTVEPVEDPSDREPVPEPLWRGTVDPLSAILFVNQPAYAQAGACDWTVPGGGATICASNGLPKKTCPPGGMASMPAPPSSAGCITTASPAAIPAPAGAPAASRCPPRMSGSPSPRGPICGCPCASRRNIPWAGCWPTSPAST